MYIECQSVVNIVVCDLQFNVKKSTVIAIGKHNAAQLPDMFISNGILH